MFVVVSLIAVVRLDMPRVAVAVVVVFVVGSVQFMAVLIVLSGVFVSMMSMVGVSIMMSRLVGIYIMEMNLLVIGVSFFITVTTILHISRFFTIVILVPTM